MAAYGWAMGTQSGPLNAFGNLVAASFFVFAPALYLLPTYEAWRRGHHNLTALALVNVLLGWTFLGWVGAYVWAFMAKSAAGAAEPLPPARWEAQQPPPPAPVAPVPGTGPLAAPPSLADELRKLADLKRDGILTEDEFRAQKAVILKRARQA